jgi:hypothetical protein
MSATKLDKRLPKMGDHERQLRYSGTLLIARWVS